MLKNELHDAKQLKKKKKFKCKYHLNQTFLINLNRKLLEL